MGEGGSELLEAFRRATDWSDEQALHYAACKMCDPIGYRETYDCEDSPGRYVPPPPGPRYVYVPELPKSCYQAGAGFMVHVQSACRCSR